jgi:hypothetical protein
MIVAKPPLGAPQVLVSKLPFTKWLALAGEATPIDTAAAAVRAKIVFVVITLLHT